MTFLFLFIHFITSMHFRAYFYLNKIVGKIKLEITCFLLLNKIKLEAGVKRNPFNEKKNKNIDT